MERKLIETRDGSHSVEIPELRVTYHSIHGAEQESMHVFIEAGLHFWQNKNSSSPVRILEMGFGTGLNALLAMEFASRHNQPIEYSTVEKFPLPLSLASNLNYCASPQRAKWKNSFNDLHLCSWEQYHEITPLFLLKKFQTDLADLAAPEQPWQLIFFDAFAPTAQPELWSVTVFQKLAGFCEPGAILTTYCSKSDVRRNLQAAGWKVEKIPGPRGKREMLRATRER